MTHSTKFDQIRANSTSFLNHFPFGRFPHLDQSRLIFEGRAKTHEFNHFRIAQTAPSAVKPRQGQSSLVKPKKEGGLPTDLQTIKNNTQPATFNVQPATSRQFINPMIHSSIPERLDAGDFQSKFTADAKSSSTSYSGSGRRKWRRRRDLSNLNTFLTKTHGWLTVVGFLVPAAGLRPNL